MYGWVVVEEIQGVGYCGRSSVLFWMNLLEQGKRAEEREVQVPDKWSS